METRDIIEIFSGNYPMILAAVALVAVCLLVLRDMVFRTSEDRGNRGSDQQEHVAKLVAQANGVIADLRSGRLVTPSIILKAGEKAYLQEPTQFYESRSTRFYGGAATRVGRMSFGGGASQSVQTLKRVDEGNLVLTDQRLIFDGAMENRVINLADVVSAQSMSEAIEVSSSRRQKSQVYTVDNPVLWCTLITTLAQGREITPVRYEA